MGIQAGFLVLLDIYIYIYIYVWVYHHSAPGASAAAAGCHQPALEASSAAPPWGWRQLVRIYKGFIGGLYGFYMDSTGVL